MKKTTIVSLLGAALLQVIAVGASQATTVYIEYTGTVLGSPDVAYKADFAFDLATTGTVTPSLGIGVLGGVAYGASSPTVSASITFAGAPAINIPQQQQPPNQSFIGAITAVQLGGSVQQVHEAYDPAQTLSLVQIVNTPGVPYAVDEAFSYTLTASDGFFGQFCASGACTSLQPLTVAESLSPFDAPSTTPLPAALPLLASGLAGIGVMGWRRKRKHTA
jgi:hypothetical protein